MPVSQADMDICVCVYVCVWSAPERHLQKQFILTGEKYTYGYVKRIFKKYKNYMQGDKLT